MAEQVNWQQAEDRRDVVHRAVQSLVEGCLVIFPTETVYGIAALAGSANAVERLLQIKGRSTGKPFTLALSKPEDSHQYVQEMSAIGRRFVRRCWPGPVTLVFAQNGAGSAMDELPETVRRQVVSEKGVGLRVPAHPAILETLRLLPGPLVLTSANRSGEPPPVEANAAIAAVGDSAQIALDDGPTRFGSASTVVHVTSAGFEVLREGIVSVSRLSRLANEVITFVCTGNSCRSPMAEAILKRLLADKLNCAVEQLPERGFTIVSAGVGAIDGAPASQQAREVVRNHRANLDDHVSQQLTAELAELSDRLVVMTEGHRQAVHQAWPGTESKVTLLCGDRDVEDPVGQPVDRYRACSEQMLGPLRSLVEALTAHPGR